MRYVLKPHMESYCPLNYLKVHFKKKCKRKPLTHLRGKMEKGGFEVPPFLISAKQWDIWCLSWEWKWVQEPGQTFSLWQSSRSEYLTKQSF